MYGAMTTPLRVTSWSPRHTAWQPGAPVFRHAPVVQGTPGLRQPALGYARMGQQQIPVPAVFLGLVSLALAAGTAYVGIDYGRKQKGLKSAMGWIVGVGGGIATLARAAGYLGDLYGQQPAPTTSVPVVS